MYLMLNPVSYTHLEVKAEKMAKKYDCAFVDNEMPYGRVPQGHPAVSYTHLDVYKRQVLCGTAESENQSCFTL